jgi:queuine tRNA-ribosyltransferase
MLRTPQIYSPRDFCKFEILHESKKSQARVGRIHSPHGIIDTPGFASVATNSALKGVDFRDADQAGQQRILSNTYHLMLHPGSEIRQAGGIHKFTNRNRPSIASSGGFQVFSLAYGSVHEELSSKGELKRASRGGGSKKKSDSHGGMKKKPLQSRKMEPFFEVIEMVVNSC